MREYDEEQALMGYVWQNYPEIMRPHQAVRSPEQVREALPAEFKDEYARHAAECERIIQESRERDRLESGGIVLGNVILPQMRPELAAAFREVVARLERETFWERFRPHQASITIHRCPKCNRILVNEKTRQCLWCGHDWHQR